jgi:glutathione synthase/RimK-type ligase-like ATP-grasp enzyme
MSLKILPYKMGSESAKALAQTLDVLRVFPDGDFVPKSFTTIMNWGYSGTPVWMSRAEARSVKILNKPTAVNVAANKLSALQALQRAGVRVPEFTTDFNVASRWLNSGATVFERHDLRGNSGAGIRVVNLDDDEVESRLTSAPLYTKFLNKTAEFRVHVFNGQVIDYVQKKRLPTERRGDNYNKYISSVDFGWVFSRTDVSNIPDVRNAAISAVRVLGLDFGAVDVVYYEGVPYVLEVNTSPGLKGHTLVCYCNAIRRFLGLTELSTAVVQRITGTDRAPSVGQTQTPAPAAATSASVGRSWETPVTRPAPNPVNDDVVLRLDRGTALKLKQLLAYV